MSKYLIEKAKKELIEFMQNEWDKSEENYLQNTQPYKTLLNYLEKDLNNKKINKEYRRLLKTLNEDEKDTLINFQLKILKKTGLEFIIGHASNQKEMNEFEIHNLAHIQNLRNPSPDYSQN